MGNQVRAHLDFMKIKLIKNGLMNPNGHLENASINKI